ncbi:WD repeat-containing protein 44-like isoform X2 [Tubulanus polymorphus]|uniref:WD repeat-containing protein 44-like isoform X2 n=1 Tax=Tubulanus polymorphus TaxID=672921 RepID=UPI003DA5CF6F
MWSDSDTEEFYDAEDNDSQDRPRSSSKRSVKKVSSVEENIEDGEEDELQKRLAELERKTNLSDEFLNEPTTEPDTTEEPCEPVTDSSSSTDVKQTDSGTTISVATDFSDDFDDVRKKLENVENSETSEEQEQLPLEQQQQQQQHDSNSAPAAAGAPALSCVIPDIQQSTPSPEPDIVQSTKQGKSIPPRPPPPRPPLPKPGVVAPTNTPAPVAPPRRKRHKQPGVQINIHNLKQADVSTTTGTDSEPSTPPIVGLPNNDDESCGRAVYELDHVSMDVKLAASGSRMVESKDDLAARAERSDAERLLLLDTDSVNRDTSDSQSMDSEDVRNMRPRSNSGRILTDKEILDMVSVTNLDTGETILLSEAEVKLPQGINPLTLHIMRRTKEYSSDGSLQRDADGLTQADGGKSEEQKTAAAHTRTIRGFKKILGKTVEKIKTAADEMLRQDESSSDDEVDPKRPKIKASRSHKGPHEFENLKPIQELKGQNMGAAWVMKFSPCGQLLAVGGQDNILRIWVLKEAFNTFENIRLQYSEATKISPSPSSESLTSLESSQTAASAANTQQTVGGTGAVGGMFDEEEEFVYKNAPFVNKPFCMYRGHTADLLDVSWSKNYFILSSSMDKTVRLWHISRKECLCSFQHIDFVTAIAFHPRDERYFLSGSLDGKLRLWNIPDKKVELWNEISGTVKLITAANFCMNGKYAVVGTYDGRCLFYQTERLKFHTAIDVRSTRGKNSRGRKITGIEPHLTEDKMLVTSNDSRLRLYDLRDLTLTCKYKGCTNNSSQIKASFSSDCKYIICGSENSFVYIWKTYHDFHKFSSARRDRNDYWEGIRAHSVVVTSAVFAPNPNLIIKRKTATTPSGVTTTTLTGVGADGGENVSAERRRTLDHLGEVLVTADFNGTIKIFKNRFRQIPAR